MTVNPPGTPAPAGARPPRASAASVGRARHVSGGSEVYRIEPNGNPRRIWTHAQDVVYAIAFDAHGPGAARRGE